jgi:hypothetical protein
MLSPWPVRGGKREKRKQSLPQAPINGTGAPIEASLFLVYTPEKNLDRNLREPAQTTTKQPHN